MWTCKLVPGPDSKTEFMWRTRKISIGFTQEDMPGDFFLGDFDIFFCTTTTFLYNKEMEKWSGR